MRAETLETLVMYFAASTISGAGEEGAADRFRILVDAARDLDTDARRRLLRRLEDGRAHAKAPRALNSAIRRLGAGGMEVVGA